MSSRMSLSPLAPQQGARKDKGESDNQHNHVVSDVISHDVRNEADSLVIYDAYLVADGVNDDQRGNGRDR